MKVVQGTDGECKRKKKAEEEKEGYRGRVGVFVLCDEDGEIKLEMDRKGEMSRGRFNELMTVLTTRCLLSPAQTQPMK